jgi:serine/threonine protein kinase
VEQAIGHGAMGAVFAVRDERSNRRYALKWISFDGGLGERDQIEAWAKREIKALQLLQHPSILQLYDHGASADAYWVVTELLTGKDLLAHVEANGVMSWQACAAVGAALCSALAAAHAQGIVHRDVKPGNLFLCDDGRFILLDFGIAKASVGARQDTMANNANTVLAGTVSFLSPERVAGDAAAPSTDMFAAGGTLQWLLTRALPFQGATMLDVLKAIAANKRSPLLRSDLNPQLVQVIDRLLTPDPAARQGAAQTAATLTKLLGGDTAVRMALLTLAAEKLQDAETNKTQLAAAPSGGHTAIVTNVQTAPTTRAGKKSSVKARIGIVSAAALLVIAGVFAFSLRPHKAEPKPPEDVVKDVTPDLPPPSETPPPEVPNVVVPPPDPPAEDKPAAVSLTFEHWVDLTLDGKSLGRKEFTTRLSVAPGKHTLVAEHPRFGTRKFPIDARAGRTTNLHIDLSGNK